MASTEVCAGCHQNLPKREYLTCKLCELSYDLECANVSSKRFYNSMNVENKKSWKCQACYCNLPKSDNTNTPIRPRDREQLEPSPPKHMNVTRRNKNTNTQSANSSTDETSLLGETLNNENSTMLHNLSEIIHQRLRENNSSIILELKNTIQQEIHNAITKFKEDIQQKTSKLFEQNESRMKEIEYINTKIKDITEENEKLKQAMKQIESKINTGKNTYEETHTSNEMKNKRIVLYGLPEYQNEPECIFYNRITEIVYNITEIDITGYIEEVYRIGKNFSSNRPLMIELISKRMTRCLLENKHYFKGSGLFISEYLDAEERKQNKKLRYEMFEARKKGHHAIIKNKQLYIDGKIISKEIENLKKINVEEKNTCNERKSNSTTEPSNSPSNNEEHGSQFFRSHKHNF